MTEDVAPIASESTWCCTKIFEYVKNRNRIGPGKIELPDCDFFIVGPRRTLRVLVPTPRGSVYYETTRNERPETIDENFVSRWASRPHPSGNCRCSFRHSKSRYSTNEERMISDEINRIRTSLCEAEKSGEDIDKLEQRISLNLDVLTTDCAPIVTREPSRNDIDDKTMDATTDLPTAGNDNEKAMKNKIVKDLESYIERLLHEVLSDTMKFFNDAGDTLRKSHEVLKKSRKCSCESVCLEPKHLETCPSTEIVASGLQENTNVDESTPDSVDNNLPTVDNEDCTLVPSTNSFDISFAFHREEEFDESTKDEVKDVVERGHVNRGFDGTTMDPDSLDFHLAKTSSNEIENLDCIDSGINSVETMEFQTLQEPSLEESLMEIIDAKFGRSTTTKSSWNQETDERTPCRNNETINNEQKVLEEIDRCVDDDEKSFSRSNDETTMKNTSQRIESIQPSKETSDESMIPRDDDENWMELEETTEGTNFDKLRLELLETTNSTKKPNAIVALREKLTRKLANGCKSRDEKRENAEKIKLARTKNEPIASSPPVEFGKMERRVWQDISEAPYRRDVRIDDRTDVVKFRKFRKPTIVFLHGFGSSAEIFENQLEYFSNLGYPCIAPEILGHGMSSAPDRSRDYHFDKLLKDLEIVLQHYAFAPGNKCVLVAHNYGCSFATALACKYDSNIHQLVLISGGGPTPLAAPSTEGAGHCCLRAMLTPLLMCGLHRDILYSARGRQHPYCGPEPVEQWPSHMKYVLDGMVWPEGDYVFHRRICTPTLLIHGLRDDKVSLVQECQMERTIIKAFLDAIPTAGHTPMTDCPEQVNHMIHCFIDLWRRKKR